MTIKVLVDITGGTVNSVLASEDIEIVFYDTDDSENIRASMLIDHDPTEVWASKPQVDVNADAVGMTFDSIVWFEDEGDKA